MFVLPILHQRAVLAFYIFFSPVIFNYFDLLAGNQAILVVYIVNLIKYPILSLLIKIKNIGGISGYFNGILISILCSFYPIMTTYKN